MDKHQNTSFKKKNMKKNDIDEIKRKLGIDKYPNINPPEDYSSIKDDKWYYILGDGGMLGRDVKANKITMTRVKTWREHKEDQIKVKQLIEDEIRKRELAERW